MQGIVTMGNMTAVISFHLNVVNLFSILEWNDSLNIQHIKLES